ncbi:uncharacterized protein FIBRA_04391 [Fibroporia radiculosa]|uniref:F-box domain-containing protein n=1 Tax=Fibroporia radiculosa TaxID=599839 RepID=J4IA51_9APHY|nr:uncharacterized protein FIBRA_04391 [Fibroporia radiculosa]CCM02301.1 predicted protein [Fibroporia radiculosa]
MTRKLPQVEVLHINYLEVGSVHANAADVFLYLTAFTSITHLILGSHFPSVTVFARLLCALPRLSRLTCSGITFATRGYAQGAVIPPQQFTLTHFDANDRDHNLDVFDFLISSLIISNTQYIGLDLQILFYNDPGSFCDRIQRMLVTAGPSLTKIHVNFHFEIPRAFVDNVNLRYSVKLEVLSLTLFRQSAAQLVNIYAVISQASPSSLRQVLLVFPDIRDPELDEKVSTQIDQLLSTPHYRILSTVRIEIRRGHVQNKNLEDAWIELLSTRFPRLCARGVLQCAHFA